MNANQKLFTVAAVTLVRSDLEERNVKILESRTPIPILDESILVTGEVERTTEFEKGMPNSVGSKIALS